MKVDNKRLERFINDGQALINQMSKGLDGVMQDFDDETVAEIKNNLKGMTLNEGIATFNEKRDALMKKMQNRKL